MGINKFLKTGYQRIIQKAPFFQDLFISTRKKYKLLRYGSFSTDQLISNIFEHIGDTFDVLMVHSSYGSLLPQFTGTPLELVSKLGESCGDARTLAMPAFFFGGIYGYDPIGYYKKKPTFNERRTPSQMGLISELFRRMEGTQRSLHPTHSICAKGPHTKYLLSKHHHSKLPFDKLSPFCAMAKLDTVIVGIGIHDLEALTQIHIAEGLLTDHFPLELSYDQTNVDIVTKDGQTINYNLVLSSTNRVRVNTRIRDILSPGELQEWTFHGVPMYAVKARLMTLRLCQAARRGWTIYEDAE